MNRREFLKQLGSVPLLGMVALSGDSLDQEIPFEFSQGWIPNPRATEEFSQSLPHVYSEQVESLIKQDNHKDALLYRPLIVCIKKSGLEKYWIKKRDGKDCMRSYQQGSTGSCTGHATAQTINILSAVEIVLLEKFQEFKAVCSAEGIYGLGRETANMLQKRSDGCYGSAMAKAVMQLGTLYCIKYQNVNLTDYDENRCRQFGYHGVGSELKREAKKHPVKSTVRVNNADSAWSLLGNGYPMNVCSNIGFQRKRDKEGICQPSGTWNHSMAVIARRTTKSGNRIFIILNSWGDNWCNGPYWEDMPWGTFGVEFDVFDRMCQQGDTFAYSELEGFIPQSLDDFGTKEYL
jgi:hypothetical protein